MEEDPGNNQDQPGQGRPEPENENLEQQDDTDSEDWNDYQDAIEDDGDEDGVSGEDMVLEDSDSDDLDEPHNLQDEVNWEEQRLAIINVERLAGVFPRVLRDRLMRRRRHRIVHEENNDESSEEEDEDEADADRQGASGAEGGNRSFDTQLPTQHSYLGESKALTGRTILEEDLIQDLPIISRPGIILMPGQTLPLNFFQPSVIQVMKRLIEGNKTFGVIHHRYRASQPGLIEEATIGTTAEIYEFREPSEDSLEVGFKIKAKGRQRFRVLSQRRQIDGTKIATVEILREVELGDPLYNIRLKSLDRLRPVKLPDGDDEDSSAQDEDQEDPGPSTSKGCRTPTPTTRSMSKNKKRSFKRIASNLISRLRHPKKTSESKTDKDHENKAEFMPPSVNYRLSKFNHLRTRIYHAPLTPFPNWVYEQYDGNILVERVHELLGKLRLFSQTQVSVPWDPKELSFWVAANLPLDDKHKLKLLEINCAIRRLRLEISLMERCRILCCRNCGEEIGKQEDIFSMSSEGPQGAYVNAGGYVHETLTLYKTKNLQLVGDPSTEYSWFPGYAWTICQCRYCDSHMGWKFTATDKKLSPKKFWGLSRRSIRPQLDMSTFDHPEAFEPSISTVE